MLSSLIWWGVLGGALGFIVAYGLPFARGLWAGDIELARLSVGRVIGLLLIATFLIVLGGFAAWLVAPSAGDQIAESELPRFLVLTGAGAEGLIRGATSKFS